jgi:hypothetical protein
MAERCKHCGLELFAAQRFCRACGTPTEELSGEEAPTRRMPPPPDQWTARSSASTAPTSRPETSPVYDSTDGYQPTVPPPYPSTIPPYAPPRRRSPIGWILAFIGMGLFVLVVVAVALMARFARGRIGPGGSTPPTAVRQGERQLDESNADTVTNTGIDTTLVKTFTLGDGAKVSLKNISGNITVTGWDQPQAQVTVVKRSGSDRSQVFFSNNGANLSLRTADNSGNQNIRFEVRLPRQLARVELSSVNGVIKVSDVRAEILVDGTNGSIELTEIAGVSRVRTTNGSIKAGLLEASDRGMEFQSVNGSIELTVPPTFEADLEASTVHGVIVIDDYFGVQVEKGVVGQRAKGEINEGGERLRLSTTNGNIKMAATEARAKQNAKGKQNGN